MSARAYKPYAAYKDSGVEWLGEIPAEWEVKRLKVVAPISAAKMIEKPDGTTYVGLENVESWTSRLLLDNQPESVDSVVVAFRSGDVLFGKLRPYLAKVARPDFDGVCTSEILPLRPSEEIDGNFLRYALLNAQFIDALNALTYGTKMPRVSPDQIGTAPTAVPSLPEQRAIATFLDRETARIDALVAKKERLITLLQERRTALITRAVTKGLDPAAPMKDSGVEWLGEIPAHWELKPLRTTVISCQNGVWGDDPDGDRDVVCVRVADFDRVALGVDISDPTLRAIEPRVVAERGLRSGDLLLEKSGGGENQPVGAVVIYSHSTTAVCSNFVARVVVSDTCDPQFLVYLHKALYAMRVNTRHIKQSTGIQNLDSSSYFGESVGVPTFAEQRVIAAQLARDTARIDDLMSRIQAAISRLHELRTALISAAVTGKIDVREAAQ